MTKERIKELSLLSDEILEVLTQLSNDLALCYELGTKNNNHEFWRRTYVRTFFAAVEGYCFQYKRTALVMVELSPFTGVYFSPEEQMFLKEKEYDLNEKGEITETKAKLRTAANFLFSIRMITTGCSNSEIKIDKGGREWQDFKTALKIRDRITHPKNLNEIMIGEEEVNVVWRTVNWFLNLTQKISVMLEEYGARLDEMPPGKFEQIFP